MLDGFPDRAAARRGGGSVRNAALAVVASLVGLAVLGVAGYVFGFFGSGSSGVSTSVAQASVTADKLDAAPGLVCASGEEHQVPAPAANQQTDETPLGAAQRWAADLPGKDSLVEARQYASGEGATGSARTIGWYDHDGQLLAEVTVTSDGSGQWVVGAGKYCA